MRAAFARAATAVIAGAALLLPSSVAQADSRTGVGTTDAGVSSVCTVNVAAGTHTCAGVPGITVLSLSGGQALVRVSFTPGANQTANFTVVYGSTPTGWHVNIGDSSTNNGGGGDAGTQSNDAEMEVQGQVLSVFGRDATPGSKLLFSLGGLGLGPGSVASFQVRDQ